MSGPRLKLLEPILAFAFVCILVISVAAMLYAVHQTIYENAYRRGQIDALTGEVRYELQEQGNGEMLWKEIEP